MTNGFVYRWYDNSNGKFYIGSHKGNPNDGYLGGGVLFRRAYAKRPESFTREIMYEGVYYREYEQMILDYDNAADSDVFYNLVNFAWGGGVKGLPKTKSTKKKMSEAAKGVPKSESHCKAISESLKGKTGVNSRRKVPIYSEVLDKYWDTRIECCKELGVSQSYIWSCLNNKIKNEKYKFKNVKND